MSEERPQTVESTRVGANRRRLLALLLLLQAGAALEIDPYHAERVGGVAQLVGRGEILSAVALLAAFALFLLLRPKTWALVPAFAFGLLVLLESTPHGSAAFHVLQALLLVGALVLLVCELADGGRPARLAARLLLAFLPLLLCEAAFATVARSHAVGYTLAARLWFARHWSPPGNTLGFRDVEQADDGRKQLFVVGDSFVSGVGIADVAERFPDRLGAQLGDGWKVHNLGYNGVDTRYERELLAGYPFTPDVVVLSYYTNDIVGVGAERLQEQVRYRPYRDLGRAAWLVSRSYALDFLYWLRPRGDLGAETGFLERCFTTPEVVAQHERELEELVDLARARAPLVVAVVFPDLLAPEARAAHVAPALRVFARSGVPALDVRTLLAELEPEERVVNSNDAHPSPALHARVARALAEELARLGVR